MRKRPAWNFPQMIRAKSERTEWMADDNTLTLYWLKPDAGKFTLRRSRATLSILHAGLYRLLSLSRGIGDCQRVAFTASLYSRRISGLLCVAHSAGLSTPGQPERFHCIWKGKKAAGIAPPCPPPFSAIGSESFVQRQTYVNAAGQDGRANRDGKSGCYPPRIACGPSGCPRPEPSRQLGIVRAHPAKIYWLR